MASFFLDASTIAYAPGSEIDDNIIAGEAFPAGAIIRQNAAGQWVKARGNSIENTGKKVRIALSSAEAAGQQLTALVQGRVFVNGLQNGVVYVLSSDTAGAVKPYSEVGDGDIVTVLGVGHETTALEFDPIVSGAQWVTAEASPAVIVSSTALNVTEGGASADYTVRLASAPGVGNTVTVALTGYSAEISVVPTSLEFTNANWAVLQTVTVSATADFRVEENENTTIVQTTTATNTGSPYHNIATDDVTVTVISEDNAGVVTSVENLNVTEGGSSVNYTIVLSASPDTGETVSIAINHTADLTVSPDTMNFTSANWNTPQTVTVTAVDDASAEADPEATTITYVVTSSNTSSPFHNFIVTPTDVSINDNDPIVTPVQYPPIPPAYNLATDAKILILDEFGGVDGTTVVGRTPDRKTNGNNWTTGALTAGATANVTLKTMTPPNATSGLSFDANNVAALINAGQADFAVFAEFYFPVDAVASVWALVFNYVDQSNYWYVRVDETAWNIRLYEVTAGTTTQRGSTYPLQFFEGMTYPIGVSVNGDIVVVWIWNRPIIRQNLLSRNHKTSQQVGIARLGGNTSGVVENFKVMPQATTYAVGTGTTVLVNAVYEVRATYTNTAYTASGKWEDVTVVVDLTLPDTSVIQLHGFRISDGTEMGNNLYGWRYTPLVPGAYSWSMTIDGSLTAPATSTGSFTAVDTGIVKPPPLNSPYNTRAWQRNGYPFFYSGLQDCFLDKGAGTDADLSAFNDYGIDLVFVPFGRYAREFLNKGYNTFRFNPDNCSGDVILANTTTFNNYSGLESLYFDHFIEYVHYRGGTTYMAIFSFNPAFNTLTNTASAEANSVRRTVNYFMARWQHYGSIMELGNEATCTNEWIEVAATQVEARAYKPMFVSMSWETPTHPNVEVISPHAYRSPSVLGSVISDTLGVISAWSANPRKIVFGELGETGDNFVGDPTRIRHRAKLITYALYNVGVVWWHTGNTENYIATEANIAINAAMRSDHNILFGAGGIFERVADSGIPYTGYTIVSGDVSVVSSRWNEGLALYAIHNSNHSTEIAANSVQITVNIPQAGTVRWYNLTTGSVLKTQAVSAGSQTLSFPAFFIDTMLVLNAT